MAIGGPGKAIKVKKKEGSTKSITDIIVKVAIMRAVADASVITAARGGGLGGSRCTDG